jgi:hypothetical protein
VFETVWTNEVYSSSEPKMSTTHFIAVSAGAQKSGKVQINALLASSRIKNIDSYTLIVTSSLSNVIWSGVEISTQEPKEMYFIRSGIYVTVGWIRQLLFPQ